MNTYTLLLILLAINVVVLLLNGAFWILVSIGDKKVKKGEQEMYARFQQILEKANQQALEIVLQATQKSNQLLANTEVMVEDIKKDMRANFKAAKDHNASLLQSHLQTMQEENKKFIDELRQSLSSDAQGLLKDMVDKSQQEIHGFVEGIKATSVQAQQQIKVKLDEEFQSALADIDLYRQQQKQHIDNEINQVLAQATKEIIGETISTDQHQQLIRQAINKAVEAGVFAGSPPAN